MKKFWMIAIATGLSAGAWSQTATPSDFSKLPGLWNGTLSYLDYTSNKEVKIRASLHVVTLADQTVVLQFSYPDEPGYNSADTLLIGDNGRMVGRWRLAEKGHLLGGYQCLVLEERSRDGNQRLPALIRYVLETGADRFSLSKFVRYDGAEHFIQRNQYLFRR